MIRPMVMEITVDTDWYLGLYFIGDSNDGYNENNDNDNVHIISYLLRLQFITSSLLSQHEAVAR